MPEHSSRRSFFEAVEHRIATAPAEELRAILRSLASQVAPSDRESFLRGLAPPKEAPAPAPPVPHEDGLLGDIEDLIAELKVLMHEADDESEDDDVEDPLGPYERFVDPLCDLFERAAAAFVHGQGPLARAAYERLFFEVFMLEDDYGRGIRAENLPVAEILAAGARYLCTVYEGTSDPDRPEALAAALLRLEALHLPRRLLLADLRDVLTRPLPDWQSFLPRWISHLRALDGPAADAWLREAVRLAEGAAGLHRLAREAGQEHPRAYLDWVTALREEGRYEEVVTAAEEALGALPPDRPLRARVADELCRAGEVLRAPEIVVRARREAFAGAPSVRRLLDLWEATPPDERMERMREAAGWLASRIALRERDEDRARWKLGEDKEAAHPFGTWGLQPVLAHAYLLGGDWEGARKLCASWETLGWTTANNPQGIVVPAVLRLLAGATLPANVTRLWEEARTQARLYEYGSAGEDKVAAWLEICYRDVADRAPIDPETAAGLLDWCVGIVERRVESIVGSQHRGSYGHAATLTVALAEVQRMRGAERQAEVLLERIRNRYPRHRAFQDELRHALARRGGTASAGPGRTR